jgi:hypothetical protein
MYPKVHSGRSTIFASPDGLSLRKSMRWSTHVLHHEYDERIVKTKNKRAIFVFGIVVLALSALSIWLLRELRIDTCLDRGGQWDYEQRKCDGARSV